MTILYSGMQVKLHDLPEKFHHVIIPAENEIKVTEGSLIAQSDDTVSQVTPEATAQHIAWDNGTVDFNVLINDFETQLIVQALKMTEGNKKEAARLLNLKRTTLLEKIKKKDIDGEWEK
jgi:DNA-binding NtrC family response regulator